MNTEKVVKWECRNCGSVFTEGELNNKLECPRCGNSDLSPAIQLSLPFAREDIKQSLTV